MIVCNICGVMM